MVVLWLALLLNSKKVLGTNPAFVQGPSVLIECECKWLSVLAL